MHPVASIMFTGLTSASAGPSLSGPSCTIPALDSSRSCRPQCAGANTFAPRIRLRPGTPSAEWAGMDCVPLPCPECISLSCPLNQANMCAPSWKHSGCANTSASPRATCGPTLEILKLEWNSSSIYLRRSMPTITHVTGAASEALSEAAWPSGAVDRYLQLHCDSGGAQLHKAVPASSV